MATMLFFEALLAFWLAIVPVYAIMVYRMRKVHPVSIVLLGFVYALMVSWGLVFYGSFIEPKLLTMPRFDVTLSEKRDMTLRIVVVGDMHFGAFRHEDWAEKIVTKTNALEPDVIVLAGDHVSNMSGTEAFSPLAGFESRYGVYAVLGNSDYHIGAVDVRHAIERYGIEVLTNESVKIDVEGRVVRLIGLDDLWFGKPDWDAALAEVEDGAVKILAVHNPDAVMTAELRGIDLVVSGHTHGGQVRFPFIGAVPPLPTELDDSYDKGLFTVGKTQLFITSGVGESDTRARLFNPPEIALLEIRF